MRSFDRSLILIGVVVLVIGGIIAVLVSSYTGDAVATPQDGVTFAEVAEEPGRLEGERVTIAGTWTATDELAASDADDGLVLTAGDERVTVVPQRGITVPLVRPGIELVVTGDVRDGVVEAERVRLVDEQDHPVDRVGFEMKTVRELLRPGPPLYGGPINVEGRVSGVGGRSFRLSQGRATILVRAPVRELDLEGLADGEQVRIRAAFQPPEGGAPPILSLRAIRLLG